MPTRYTYGRTASTYDVQADMAQVSKRFQAAQTKEADRIFRKADAAMEPLGYELDSKRSYLHFHPNSDQPVRVEGEMLFKPISARDPKADEATWRKAVRDHLGLRDFQVYSLSGGAFSIYVDMES